MIHTQDLPLSLGAHSRHSSPAAGTGLPLGDGKRQIMYLRMYICAPCMHTHYNTNLNKHKNLVCICV